MLRGGPLYGTSGQGPLLAGNLSVLTTLLGTPWDVDYSGAVLVVEEVGESPFRVERSLKHLALAGKFDSLAALVFGRFSRCEAAHGPAVDEVIERFAQFCPAKFPVVSGLPVGHWGENQPLPLGCAAEVVNDCFRLLESPVA